MKDKAKIRLLLVCTVPTNKSGIPNVIFNILHAIDKNDMEIGYVSINNPDNFYIDKLNEYGVKLYVIPRKLSNPLKYVLSLAKIAKNYDIMHVHGNSATMLLEMIAAKLGGVRVRAAHAHTTSCSMRWCDKISRPLFFEICNCRIACGQDAGKWLFGNRKFKIINNGIDTVKFRFNLQNRNLIRGKYGIAENTFTIGHVGNFVEAKNHKFIIEIFFKIKNKIPNVKLLLLGDGESMDSIKRDVENLNLSNDVFFAGSVNNPEVYMSAMDLILMPSLYEGFPLTLVEEQVNGLQCIVADTITRDANMTGNLKFLSLDSPISEWASEIEDTISNCNIDRMEMSDKAIKNIRKHGFDIYEIAKQLKDYYICQLDEEKKS